MGAPPGIRYLTQASIRPPTFIVFTDKHGGRLHFSAERFLANQIRKKFGFDGTPVVVKNQRASQK
jgi:GTP-binding protein